MPRPILHGYFNPLVFWYPWDYLLTSKEFIFCRVSKIGNDAREVMIILKVKMKMMMKKKMKMTMKKMMMMMKMKMKKMMMMVLIMILTLILILIIAIIDRHRNTRTCQLLCLFIFTCEYMSQCAMSCVVCWNVKFLEGPTTSHAHLMSVPA